MKKTEFYKVKAADKYVNKKRQDWRLRISKSSKYKFGGDKC